VHFGVLFCSAAATEVSPELQRGMIQIIFKKQQRFLYSQELNTLAVSSTILTQQFPV